MTQNPPDLRPDLARATVPNNARPGQPTISMVSLVGTQSRSAEDGCAALAIAFACAQAAREGLAIRPNYLQWKV